MNINPRLVKQNRIVTFNHFLFTLPLTMSTSVQSQSQTHAHSHASTPTPRQYSFVPGTEGDFEHVEDEVEVDVDLTEHEVLYYNNSIIKALKPRHADKSLAYGQIVTRRFEPVIPGAKGEGLGARGQVLPRAQALGNGQWKMPNIHKFDLAGSDSTWGDLFL